MKAIRLTLLSHALTDAQRRGRFHLDDDGVRGDADVARAALLATNRRLLSAPEARARQTAALLGGEAHVEEGLRDCDVGRWRGLSLKHLEEADPAGLQAWLADPAAAPHGGESIAQLCRRVGTWLDGLRTPGDWLAVSHPFVIRAALIHVLQSPLYAFQRIDVPPLAALELGFSGVWRYRLT